MSGTEITSEVRLHDKPPEMKKSSDILLNKGSDTPSVKSKKLKIIIPKKKVREKSNEATDEEKAKTKRKEKTFIINITKKNTNATVNDKKD